MSVEGIILHHGEAGGVTLHQTRIDYLLTAENSKQCSLFEFSIAPGFNTGAHYHTKIEELFYDFEGSSTCVAATEPYPQVWVLSCSSLPAPRTPSAIPVPRPAACFSHGAPGHEKYFDELRDLVDKGGKPDPDCQVARKV